MISHLLLFVVGSVMTADIYDRVVHGYADSDGVKIHYASLGEGPLVVMLHGFPDFWYSWRDQMAALEKSFKVVAIDLRGYNQSDKPEGVASYAMPLLVGDVAAVIGHLGHETATVVGHDWGGAIAWQLALLQPDKVERLVILNLPHPNGLMRELRNNETQYRNSEYARIFQQKAASAPDVFFGGPMMPETMSAWVRDPSARKRYVEAFARSDFEAMLNYYKANYPRVEPGASGPAPPPLPKAKMPVLMFHGLEDRYLLSDALNNTWDWLEKDLTLVTVPGAGHFVQQDASELVTETMKWWLLR
ncbi:MAG TPA: alpha/beta hydrolase [Vicinamibacteria bacterium]|nr:alpha/beta hydrolase [Vicinamibacteria bacterium]